MPDIIFLPKQGHSIRAKRSQHMLHIQIAAQRPSGSHNLFSAVHRHAGSFTCFFGIRSKQIGTMIAGNILRLGVDQNFQIVTLRRRLTDILQKRGVNYSLAVIRHHCNIKSRRQCGKSFPHFTPGLSGHGRTVFLVQSDHLLITRQHSDLYCSRTFPAPDQMRRYPGITQHAVQTLPVSITPA